MAIERRHTAEEQQTGFQFSLRMVGTYAIFVGIIGSFIAGALLGENSIGGARPDFYNFHWPTIVRFSTMSWRAAVEDYPVTVNPLLYIIASLFPLHDDPKSYHFITFVVALLIWPLLAWAYHRRYSKYGIDWFWALFGASTILISPTFRSSAFWGTTDYLPFVFCAGTSLLLSRFQDSEHHKTSHIGLITLVFLAAVSACAFYTRQLYAFLPICAAWIVLTRTKTSPLLVLSVFFITMLPEMFLVYIWKGINPPSLQFVFHPAIVNVLLVGANIGLLSAPLILGCIRQSLSDVLPEWWRARSTVIAFLGLLVFITALGTTEWPEMGGGIIVKTGARMGTLGTPFILAVSYFGLVVTILFAMRSATNALLAGAFVLPLFTSRFSYQHYLEPSLSVAVFLFADTQTATTVFNKSVLMFNFVFSALILGIGIVYYDVFHGLLQVPR